MMTDGLAWTDGDVELLRLPSKSAIFQARERLGAELGKALLARVVQPLAVETAPGSFLAGRRLVATDGTTLDVADTVANDEHFVRPGVNKGERSAFPQARVGGLVEYGTRRGSAHWLADVECLGGLVELDAGVLAAFVRVEHDLAQRGPSR